MVRNDLLNYDRNTDPDVMDSKKNAYIKENKSSFSALIEQVRKRKKEEAEKGMQYVWITSKGAFTATGCGVKFAAIKKAAILEFSFSEAKKIICLTVGM